MLSEYHKNREPNQKIKFISLLEIKKFISISLYMGILVLPQIKMYWENPKTSSFGQDFVRKLMSYKRYTEINTNISINSMDENVASEKKNVDESASKILQYVNKVSQSIFYPSEKTFN
ncbi:hypothetical protein CDIK_4136 [Cucumispora dikerogammari]|nr:hypothetical protein CDIK_4136 [Cucumispora dikerogammari]